MTMKRIKIADAPPRAIDWLVATCEGIKLRGVSAARLTIDHQCEDDFPGAPGYDYAPSSDPAQGQPILEREKVCLFHYQSDERGQPCEPGWCAYVWVDGNHSYGPTMLIAGLRCFLASRFGEEAEVPEELL